MSPPSAGDRTGSREQYAPNDTGGSPSAEQQGQSAGHGQGQSAGQGQGQSPSQGQGQANGQGQPNGQGSGQGSQADGEQSSPAGWFASAALRTGIVTVGFVLFLFALGQAVGFNLLDLFIAAVTSQTGRWIVVAVFALLLIAAAGKGLNRPLTGG